MNRVENTSKRAPFFPNQKAKNVNENNYTALSERGASPAKDKLQNDAKVSIPMGTKMFSRIKKLVDRTPPQDNMEKIENLRSQIQSGNYKINENKLADKVLQNEFELWRER
ncbi:MAG: flagellar biosynthesis anti-sigma factor FlgM [Deltaproteobacteria bacterium]|nr:MAG: flagellar biosynthesis anti-sigma factor FlgM [Deltaproteobacteria bacterium]